MGKARAAPKAPRARSFFAFVEGATPRGMVSDPMSDSTQPSKDDQRPAGSPPDGAGHSEALDPGRLLRIAGVTREVLEEARRIRPEAGAVDPLRRVHQQISQDLQEALPPSLWEEFDDLTPDVRDGSLEELALAHAEILGWQIGRASG